MKHERDTILLRPSDVRYGKGFEGMTFSGRYAKSFSIKKEC